MAINLMEAVQKKLGLPPLQKIDPNIQETKGNGKSSVDKLTQAALPAVLAALYKTTRTEDGTWNLLNTEEPVNCMSDLFHGLDDQAIDKVAKYAGVDKEVARTTMDEIAAESVAVIRQVAGEKPGYEKIEHYMNGQRHQILVHLPAALQMGKLLDDDTLDDRTNKMEGPVSTFMNKLGDTLADGESKQGTF